MPLRLDDADMEQTPPQTEDSAERGFVKKGKNADPATYRDLGKSDEIDQDEVGDIADEGSGHRG